jgi:putative PEP-CTERM system histidine kinase
MSAALFTIAAWLVLRAHPGTRQATCLAAALSISVLWAAGLTYTIFGRHLLVAWVPSLDAVHTAAWVFFLGTMLAGQLRAEAARVAYVLMVGALLLVILVVVHSRAADLTSIPSLGESTTFVALITLPLGGFLALEQLFRNASFQQRRALRPLAIGVGAIFSVDVFVYSEALLFGALDPNLWSFRGLANAVAAPLILFAVKRQPDWQRDLFVSRQIVFYSTSLVGAGAYLLIMGIGGFYIGLSGGSWVLPLQVLFFLGAGGVFLYALFSVTLHRRLRVFIAKHFYQNRYDYREEWLRLIGTLANRSEASTVERCVKALADIVGAAAGDLWLAKEPDHEYEYFGGLATNRRSAQGFATTDAIVRFLKQTHWIIDTREYTADPERYENAFALDSWYLKIPSVFVPLVHEDQLVGIVRLDRPSDLAELGYEDHDLLKTAGKQVAIFLVQDIAQEKLSETRQFETFSRLSTFLMHDLKNLVAQQELLVANAQRFKHRQDFIEDAIGTMVAGVQRMKRVLGRLGESEIHDRASRVNVGPLLRSVVDACSDRLPVPTLQTDGASLHVNIDREKFGMAIAHAIRNAQDATDADGTIALTLTAENRTAVIQISDTGAGMDETFIRERLFRPFDSTKGAKGMGIGAYQIRETLRAAGGDVRVTSQPGKGTVMQLRLPKVESVSAGSSVPIAQHYG